MVDPPPDQFKRIDRQIVELARLGLADHGGELARAGSVAGADHTAVPPRGAEGEASRLEEHDPAAALGETECGGKPRHATADDADVGLDVAVERRSRPVVDDAAAVVAVDVAFGHRRQAQASSRRVGASLPSPCR